MSFRPMLRPGQGFKPYTVLRRKGGKTASGRPKTAGLESIGTIYGIISQASQTEQEQWKQKGHPITHTVIQRGTKNAGKADDVLELRETGDDGVETVRHFLIQGTRDPGEIGHFTVYKVEEREDLQ